MRKITILLTFLLCIIFSFNLSVKAASIKDLPMSKSSRHWEVEIVKAIEGTGLSKAIPGKINMYGLNVKNLEKNVYNLHVSVYRNDQHFDTLHSIIDPPVSTLEKDNEFNLSNFPVSVKAEEIIVIITWQDEPFQILKNGEKIQARKHKELFVFKQS